MDNRAVVAVVVGTTIYVLVIILRAIQGDLTGQQLILMLATPSVTGFLSGGVRKGLIIGFLVSFVMLIVESIVIMPGAFTNPNVVMAVIVMVLPFAGISLALGAAGGFLGKRLSKK